jgi:DASH complex subunit DAD1
MSAPANAAQGEKTYFEQQRELAINDVAAVCLIAVFPKTPLITIYQSLENVLQNINKLNRSLEGVIAVY